MNSIQQSPWKGDRPEPLRRGLSVVVPVYNKARDVAKTLDSILAAVTKDRQIILVDDCSTDRSSELIQSYCDQFEEITSIALSRNSGAGVARNAGIPLVRHDHVIFFDADDHLEPGSLDEWLHEMRKSDADVAMCQYTYISNGTALASGMHPADRRIWSGACRSDAPEVIELKHHSNLLEFTNYPWNKIYKTQFLIDKGIQFSATPVNNDIFFHWASLCAAETIQLIPKAYCKHFVSHGADQITQDFSRRRLCLFDALDDVEHFFAADPASKKLFYVNFLRFKIAILRWAHARVPEDFIADFEDAMQRHYARMALSDVIADYERMPGVVAISAMAAHSPRVLIKG